MSKPRQEFLGPITNLAAIFDGNNWVSDGYGIIDGYGAVIQDITAVGLNARASGPGAQSAKGSFWVHSGSPTLPYFTDSSGNDIELGGGDIPLGPLNCVYWSDGLENAWSAFPMVSGLTATSYVSIGALGSGSLRFSANLASAPVIRQDPINNAGLAQTFLISSQANGSDPGMVGGALEISGGAGWQQGTLSLSGYWIYLDSSKVRLSKSEDTIIGMGSVSAIAMQASNLSLQAESNSHLAGFGGDLVLMGGNGGSTDGSVKIQTPTGVGSGVDNISFSTGKMSFDSSISAPIIKQDPIDAVASGQVLTIQAQDNGTEPGMFGGRLLLSGGEGWRKGIAELSGSTVYVDSQDLYFRPGYGNQRIGQGNISVAATKASSLILFAESNSNGTGIGGDLILLCGNGGSADGYLKIQTPTSSYGVGIDNINFSTGKMSFDSSISAPIIKQDPINTVVSGQILTIQAQGNGTDPGMFGGKLLLSGGEGWHKGSVELAGTTVLVNSTDIAFTTDLSVVGGYVNSRKIGCGTIFAAGLKAGSLTLFPEANTAASGIGGDLRLIGGYSGGEFGVIKFLTPNSIVGGGEENLTISKTSSGTTIQSAYSRLIGINNEGYGSCAIIPRAHPQALSAIPRMDKHFGTFKITGTSETRTLTFQTNIHGYPMPASTVLVGRFMIGWLGDGNVTSGGAMQFLYTVSSDASGNIVRLCSSLSNNYAVPGGGLVQLTSGSAPPATTGVSEYTLQTGVYTPLLRVSIPTAPTITYSFNFQAINNGAPANIATYFWENEYGWGDNE